MSAVVGVCEHPPGLQFQVVILGSANQKSPQSRGLFCIGVPTKLVSWGKGEYFKRSPEFLSLVCKNTATF
jgi:hypothetical protein